MARVESHLGRLENALGIIDNRFHTMDNKFDSIAAHVVAYRERTRSACPVTGSPPRSWPVLSLNRIDSLQTAVDGGYLYGIGTNQQVYKVSVNGGSWANISVDGGYVYGIGRNQEV